MAVDGSGLRRLAGDPGLDDVLPAVDRRRPADRLHDVRHPDGSVGDDVWTVDADGTDRRRLTTAASNDTSPDPRPRG